MAIFVLSDLHLSTGDKTTNSMEVFGNRWQDYISKIEDGLSDTSRDDVCNHISDNIPDFEPSITDKSCKTDTPGNWGRGEAYIYGIQQDRCIQICRAG